MYCTKCGKKINKDEKFCSSCGNLVQNQNIQLNVNNYKNINYKQREIIAIITIIISILGLFCTLGIPFLVFLLGMLIQLIFDYKTIEGDPWQKLEFGDFFKIFFPNFNNSIGLFSSHSLTIIITLLLIILLITSIIYIVKINKKNKQIER